MSAAAFDDRVLAVINGERYTRSELAQVVAGRLDRAQLDDLTRADCSTDRLADLLATAGVSAVIVPLVLSAESRPAAEVAEVLPSLGLPTVLATKLLAAGWDMSITDAGAMLSATPEQMREAGAPATELHAACPEMPSRSTDQGPHRSRSR